MYFFLPRSDILIIHSLDFWYVMFCALAPKTTLLIAAFAVFLIIELDVDFKPPNKSVT